VGSRLVLGSVKEVYHGFFTPGQGKDGWALR